MPMLILTAQIALSEDMFDAASTTVKAGDAWRAFVAVLKDEGLEFAESSTIEESGLRKPPAKIGRPRKSQPATKADLDREMNGAARAIMDRVAAASDSA